MRMIASIIFCLISHINSVEWQTCHNPGSLTMGQSRLNCPAKKSLQSLEESLIYHGRVLHQNSYNTFISLKRSSAPYISGDTFRSFCHYICDETGCNFKPEQIKDGNAIFVKVDELGYFASYLHPRIKSKYILITHNGDLPVPNKFSYLLNDPRLIAWFGQNVENYTHPKLHPIPIGIANRNWPHGNIQILSQCIECIPTERDILLYVNINIGTNRSLRQSIYEKFAQQPYSFTVSSTSFENYLHHLGRSKFALSPRGNGLDTHRTWEALYMGAIPIVQSSSMDSVFKDLPVLIINNWDELSEEFLIQKYEEMNQKKYNREKLYAEYWHNQIFSLF